MITRASRRPRGQATVEYSVVVALVVLVLITEQGAEPGPVGLVVQALKDLFEAYSWAISYSNNVTPL